MKKFRKIVALFLTLLMTFSFLGMKNVYAVTEMSDEEQERIISLFGELPPERSRNKTLAQRVAGLFSTRAATIPDGVYYIKNNATGAYLNVVGASPEESAQVEVTGKSTTNPSGNSPNRLSQLWRVTYVNGDYILRPLHMLNLTFAAHTRNNILVMTYYNTNNNVVMYAKWDIDGSINDCNIIDVTFDKAVTLDSNYDVAFTDDHYDDKASWSFEPVTNIPSGVIVYGGDVNIKTGETVILTASAYSPTLQFGTVTWATANSSIASLSQISSDNTQKKVVRRAVTGGKSGATTLTMTCATDSSIKTTYYVAVDILVYGEYYIRNRESEMYIDIKGPSMSSGTNICQQTGTANDSQRWLISFDSSDGCYSIKSVYSSLYMTVSGNETHSTAQIVQSEGNSASTQKWKIEGWPEYGIYTLSPKYSQTTYYKLGLMTDNSSDGTNIVCKLCDNSTYNEWYIIPAIYGTKTFRTLSSSLWGSINCLGYALMRNDAPNWDFKTKSKAKELYSAYSYNDQGNFDDNVINQLSATMNLEFKEWLGKNVSHVEYEANFDGNGQSRPLQANQYRIVIRAGMHYLPQANIVYYDYHVWYQIFDGRWANKHGDFDDDVSSPQLLGKNETPYLEDSVGWNFKYKFNGATYTFKNFYDGEIFSYIITL